MISYLRLLLLLLAFCAATFAKGQDTSNTKKWEVEAGSFFVVLPNQFIPLPVVQATRGKLYMEGHYNYEELNTATFFLGYSFDGNKKLKYSIKPLIGFAFGNLSGLVPALRVNMQLGRFVLVSDSDYFVDIKDINKSFYAGWSDLVFAPRRWYWLGFSLQQLKTVRSEYDIDRGLTVGVTIRNVRVVGYYFNLTRNDQFGIIGLQYAF